MRERVSSLERERETSVQLSSRKSTDPQTQTPKNLNKLAFGEDSTDWTNQNEQNSLLLFSTSEYERVSSITKTLGLTTDADMSEMKTAKETEWHHSAHILCNQLGADESEKEILGRLGDRKSVV